MEYQCSALTRNGSQCQHSVSTPNGLCYAHDPDRADQRKRWASKGGKANATASIRSELQSIREDLEAAAKAVVQGRIEASVGNCVSQLHRARILAVDVERRIVADEADRSRARAGSQLPAIVTFDFDKARAFQRPATTKGNGSSSLGSDNEAAPADQDTVLDTFTLDLSNWDSDNVEDEES